METYNSSILKRQGASIQVVQIRNDKALRKVKALDGLACEVLRKSPLSPAAASEVDGSYDRRVGSLLQPPPPPPPTARPKNYSDITDDEDDDCHREPTHTQSTSSEDGRRAILYAYINIFKSPPGRKGGLPSVSRLILSIHLTRIVAERYYFFAGCTRLPNYLFYCGFRLSRVYIRPI